VHRYLVTGTDTDVGKTRVSAALACALRIAGLPTTIVKLVQTGVSPDASGDAARAASLAGVSWRELARFEKPADPWSAAIAQGARAVRARDLADTLATIEGALVVEGSGGIMVPFNAREHAGHVAALATLRVVLVVGLRLGCINHALLTAALCDALGLSIAGAVLVERWRPESVEYRADVERALQGKLEILGMLPFAANEATSVEAGARLFDALMKE